MKFIISGKSIEVTPGLKSTVEQKLGKLERYFTPETEIIVTLSVEKDRQKIEVTIPVKGNIIRSEQTSSDMYVSIDLVEEVIERQLRKYKNKLVARSQGHPTASSSGSNFKKEFLKKMIQAWKITRFASSAPNVSVSNRCSRKMPASRWSFSDTASLFSATPRQMKSTLCTREKTALSV